MEDRFRDDRDLPTRETRNPNLSTENQPKGAARRPSDTLDREPARDPVSGGSIPSDYDPGSMTRKGEQKDSRAGREAAGQRRGPASGDSERDAFDPPVFHGDQDDNVRAGRPDPLTEGRDENRGRRPTEGSGVVQGSGAAAGGGGNPEDYDSDPVGGGAPEQGEKG